MRRPSIVSITATTRQGLKHTGNTKYKRCLECTVIVPKGNLPFCKDAMKFGAFLLNPNSMHSVSFSKSRSLTPCYNMLIS